MLFLKIFQVLRVIGPTTVRVQLSKRQTQLSNRKPHLCRLQKAIIQHLSADLVSSDSNKYEAMQARMGKFLNVARAPFYF